MGFGFGFDLMETLFPIFFIVFFAIFVFIAVRGVMTWNKNNNSPKISAHARLVSRRAHRSSGSHDMHGSTFYYSTFEFDTGDRMEFSMPYNEYGLLAEGDTGMLTFQGTRFLSFERERF